MGGVAREGPPDLPVSVVHMGICERGGREGGPDPPKNPARQNSNKIPTKFQRNAIQNPARMLCDVLWVLWGVEGRGCCAMSGGSLPDPPSTHLVFLTFIYIRTYIYIYIFIFIHLYIYMSYICHIYVRMYTHPPNAKPSQLEPPHPGLHKETSRQHPQASHSKLGLLQPSKKYSPLSTGPPPQPMAGPSYGLVSPGQESALCAGLWLDCTQEDPTGVPETPLGHRGAPRLISRVALG